MGGKCSGSRKKVKKLPESGMPSPCYNGGSVEQYYSADIQHLLPNVQHSRPLYRFSNRNQPSRVDLNARIVDIREVEDDLRMESMILKQNNNIPLGRCSTPDPSYCYHCDHKHRERCCLYLGDKEDDIDRYSAWTQDLEKTPVKPQNVKSIPEAVSYNTTPYWFPRYTWVKSDPTKGSLPKQSPKAFFQPFQSTTTWQELLDPNRPTSLTPYQQYIVQMRQLTQEMQSPTTCPCNHYCPQSVPHHGITYLKQFNNQHIYNGPVYMQQNNNSPYFNHFPHPYNSYQRQQKGAVDVTPPTTPIGYRPELQPCASHSHCAMKASHPQLYSRFPPHPAQDRYWPSSYANLAAQVHSDGVSFPLWMLFSHNQTKATDSGNGRKRCARRLYGPEKGGQQVDHNCNVYHQIAGCDVPAYMDVDGDEGMDDCPMQHPNRNPKDWNQ